MIDLGGDDVAIGDERVSHSAALIRIEELEARIAELETALDEILNRPEDTYYEEFSAEDLKRWTATLKGER